jgi:vitamin B12 transporter
VGATLRGFVARYGDPGDEYTNDPSAYEKEDNWLGTLFADVKLTEYITTHLILGGQDRRFEGVDPLYALNTLVRNRRGIIDWQNTFQMTGSNRLIAGLYAEDETTLDTGYGNIDRRQTLLAFYAEDEWTIVDGLYVTAGLRRDDFDTFGAATTGRITAAWLTAGRSLKLRSSYGTAFNEPSFLDLYGRDVGYVGNPNLLPERSDGWDFGVDFYVPGGRQSVSATWFQTDFRNLITDDFSVYPYTTENVGRARTRGLELEMRTVLAGIVQAKLSYTRLEATDLVAQTELLRRPHDMADADLWADLGRGVTLGAAAGWVGIRADDDAQTFALTYDPGYLVARVYAAWQATRRLTLKARVENLLNRSYEPVNGYPALGRAFFAGAEWKF